MDRDPETAAYIAQLEDAVVAAAALWFGEISGSDANYLSEGLHLMASEVIRRSPRLRDGYKGAEVAG